MDIASELLIVLVIVLLVFGTSWITRRWRKREPSQFKRSHMANQTAERSSLIGPTTRPRFAGPFVNVEQQVKVLRRQVADGLLTEKECKAQMRELMVEDSDGNWWMVGYETGGWYRHDGTDWVQADPPIHVDQGTYGGSR